MSVFCMAVSGNPGKTGTIAVERNKRALQQRHTIRGNPLSAEKEKRPLYGDLLKLVEPDGIEPSPNALQASARTIYARVPLSGG